MAKLSTLSDDFLSHDTGKWTISSAAVTFDGALTMPADPVGFVTHSASAVDTYDCTETSAVVDMLGTINGGISTLTGLRLVVSPGNRIQVFVAGSSSSPGTLFLRKVISFATTDTTLAYSPTTHRFIRYRHASGVVYVDTSADGVSWTQRLTATEIAGLTNARPEFIAGGGSSTQTPVGPALFGSINLAAGPGDQPPVASAGSDQSVAVGATVTLTGSGTDADGTIVSYAWSLLVKPESSAAALSGTGTTRTFTADVAGVYEALLTVTDDDGLTATDTVAVTASASTVDGPTILRRSADGTTWERRKLPVRNSTSDGWDWA